MARPSAAGAGRAGAGKRGSVVGAVGAGLGSVVGGSAVGKNGPSGQAKYHLKPLCRLPAIRHSSKVFF